MATLPAVTVRNTVRRAPDGIAYVFADEQRGTPSRSGVSLNVASCGGTATWSYELGKAGTRGKHIITLDPRYTDSITVAGRGGKPQGRPSQVEYGVQLVRHETAHGRYSERDFDKTRAAVATAGVEWSLVNLLEDARIEYLERVRTGTPFGWTRWNTVHSDFMHHPVKLMYKYIIAEEKGPAKWSSLLSTPEPTFTRVRGGVAELAPRGILAIVAQFYAEVCAAPDTLAVVQLAKDWTATFPGVESPEQVGVGRYAYGIGYSGGGHDTPSARGSAPTVYADNFNMADLNNLPPHVRSRLDAFVEGGLEGLQLSAEQFTARFSFDRVSFSRAVGHRVSRAVPVLDADRVRAVAAQLARMIAAQNAYESRTATSGSRLHVRNAAVYASDSFRTVTPHRGGKERKVVAIFDQSGSMHNAWHLHGVYFAAALQTLAQRRILDATVILTGGHSHCIIPRNFPALLFGRFGCRAGCESIDKTLAATRDLVRSASTVLIYTDGALTDGKVDAGEWRTRGVDLIGCAVALAHQAPDMNTRLATHFHRGIIAESGEALATAILGYVLRH